MALYSDFVFVLLVLLLALSFLKFMLRKTPSSNLVHFIEFIMVMVIVLAAACDISGRPNEGDTANYLVYFDTIKAGEGNKARECNPFSRFEPGFVGLPILLAWLELGARVLFFPVPVLVGLAYYRLATRVVFGPRSALTTLVFASLLVYPFFLMLTANVIRQGIAMAFVRKPRPHLSRPSASGS